MRSIEVIREVEARGAQVLVAEDGRLCVKRASVLTDELRAEIRRRKDGIIALLNIREVFPDARVVGVDQKPSGVTGITKRGTPTIVRGARETGAQLCAFVDAAVAAEWPRGAIVFGPYPLMRRLLAPKLAERVRPIAPELAARLEEAYSLTPVDKAA